MSPKFALTRWAAPVPYSVCEKYDCKSLLAALSDLSDQADRLDLQLTLRIPINFNVTGNLR
jgi:hypothetical protein